MTANATPAVDDLKRRQAVRVTLFLLAVAAGTVGLFHWVRADRVAYRRGEQALARKDFKLASEQLERAWARGFRLPRVRLELARARLEAGEHNAALVLYAAAHAADPADESIIDTLAGLYQGAGEPERGIALFGPPEKLSATALTRLGDLHQQAGRLEDAVAAYKLAVVRAPKDAAIRLRLGIVLGWLGRPGEAASALQATLALQPDLRLAQLYLARMHLWDGHFAEAVAEYRRVLPP